MFVRAGVDVKQYQYVLHFCFVSLTDFQKCHNWRTLGQILIRFHTGSPCFHSARLCCLQQRLKKWLSNILQALTQGTRQKYYAMHIFPNLFLLSSFFFSRFVDILTVSHRTIEIMQNQFSYLINQCLVKQISICYLSPFNYIRVTSENELNQQRQIRIYP